MLFHYIRQIKRLMWDDDGGENRRLLLWVLCCSCGDCQSLVGRWQQPTRWISRRLTPALPFTPPPVSSLIGRPSCLLTISRTTAGAFCPQKQSGTDCVADNDKKRQGSAKNAGHNESADVVWSALWSKPELFTVTICFTGSPKTT